MNRLRIFISSVQKELAEERRALKDYIEGDALLRRFFDVFLFEDLPAADRRADAVYLDEVDRCDLRVPHRSIARNHRICESMFLAGYIEKYGTGTLMMIRESVEHALPEPVFKQSGSEFVATFGRDWLTEEVMARLGLNERQREVVAFLKEKGQIGNPDYRRRYGVSKPTASRDLETLRGIGVLERVGITGKGTYYLLAGKGLAKGSKDSSVTKGSRRAHGVVGGNCATKRPSVPTSGSDQNREHRTPVASGFDSKTTQMTHTHEQGSRHKPVKPVTKRAGRKTAQVTGNIRKHPKQLNTNTLRVPARGSNYGATQDAGQVGTESGPSRNPVTVQVAMQVTMQVAKLLDICGTPRSRDELQRKSGLRNRDHFRLAFILPALADGLIEMTIPDKPTSRLQKYRLTEKGQAWLRKARP